MHRARPGKTSMLVALRDELNETGQNRSFYVNVEPAQTACKDGNRIARNVLGKLGSAAKSQFGDEFVSEVWPKVLEMHGGNGGLLECA